MDKMRCSSAANKPGEALHGGGFDVVLDVEVVLRHVHLGVSSEGLYRLHGTPWACSWLTKVCRQECGVSGRTPGTDFIAAANLSRKCVGLQGLYTPLPVQR